MAENKGKTIPTKAQAYKVEGAVGVTRLKKSCPRCGSGTFMARHANRAYCGRCHYTEFSQPPAQQQQTPQQPAKKA